MQPCNTWEPVRKINSHELGWVRAMARVRNAKILYIIIVIKIVTIIIIIQLLYTAY